MTYSEIITASLLELGRIGEGQTASASQGKTGLEVLNGLMASWKKDDIDFNWFHVKLADIGDEAPLEDWAIEGVISNLAVKMAPRVRSPVSIELATKAKTGDQTIANTLMNQQLENTDMSHLPRGSGKRGYGYDINSDTS